MRRYRKSKVGILIGWVVKEALIKNVLDYVLLAFATEVIGGLAC